MSTGLLVQWLVVALIGVAAVYALLRHFGVGRKAKVGCPGCGHCAAKPKAAAGHPPSPRDAAQI